MDQTALLVACAVQHVLRKDASGARILLKTQLPFKPRPATPRRATEREKLRVFWRDGFIDRYCGDKLVHPGLLRCLSRYFPEELPYQRNWRLECCHEVYWELCPTLDHVVPVARGGEDHIDNWVCTSMRRNAIKAQWTLQELGWSLCAPGDLRQWDGLTALFIELVEQDSGLCADPYIARWYRLSKAIIHASEIGTGRE